MQHRKQTLQNVKLHLGYTDFSMLFIVQTKNFHFPRVLDYFSDIVDLFEYSVTYKIIVLGNDKCYFLSINAN